MKTKNTRAQRGSRSGFTLLEVAIAVSIMSGVLLVLATTTGRFMHTVTLDQVRTQANVAADAHIAYIRLWPSYDSLGTFFDRTDANTPLPGWTRRTTVTQFGGSGQATDFSRVTVEVIAPTLNDTVQRTITVAATR